MKSKTKAFVSSFAIVVSLIAIPMVQNASAAIGTWSGTFDGTWDTTDVNWSDVSADPWDAINGPDNTATFNTASLAAVVSGPVFTNGITFSTTGALSGDTIFLVGSAPTIAVATGQIGNISSTIAGTAGLIKSDAGLLTLSAATYTGGTTVSGGRLALENTKTGSPDFITDAELEFNLTTGDQQLIGGTLSGTGRLVKTGGNNLVLSDWAGNQTVELTGGDSVIDVQAGTLSNFFAAGAFGPAVNWAGNEAGLTVASGATFELLNNGATVDELNGAGTISKDAWDTPVTLTIGVKDGSGTFSGSILNPKNSLAIVKEGTGTQRLSGNITHKGGTTVNGGRLILENTKTGSQSYTTQAELEFNLTTGNQQLQSGTFSGTGKLIKTGGDELILSNWGGAQTVALTGADSVIDVQAGTLSNFSAAAFGAPPTNWAGNKAGLTVALGATFQINNSTAIVDELNGAGTISKSTWDTAVTLIIGVNDGSGNFTGVIAQPVGTSLSLVKQGTGTQILSGANTYTGATTVEGGTLALGANNVLPGTAVSIGTATLDAATFTDTVGTLDVTAAATIHLGSGAALTFADSNGVDWTGGTLNLTGSFVSGSSIKFATSGGMTSDQLDLISVNGTGAGTYTLDTNGYLIAGSGDSFAAWATGGETFDGDANGDGVQDGLAWFLGAATPGTNALDKLPKPAGNGAFLTLDFQRVNPYAPAKLFVQFGNDLNGWTEVEIPASSGTIILPGDDVEVEVTGGSPDEVTVKIPTSYQSASGALFARLRATNN
jgi:fibronectin-binding autotransporter adhesin